jgi:hypothetical protein
MKVACLEEIAFRLGFIDRDQGWSLPNHWRKVATGIIWSMLSGRLENVDAALRCAPARPTVDLLGGSAARFSRRALKFFAACKRDDLTINCYPAIYHDS